MTKIKLTLHTTTRLAEPVFTFASHKLTNEYLTAVGLPIYSSAQRLQYLKRHPETDEYTPNHGKYTVKEVDNAINKPKQCDLI